MIRDRKRALVFGALALMAALAVLYFSGPSGGWFPRCMFHRLTGLDCPGCGMTRATHAALHGSFGDAFALNPLGVLVMPVVAGFVVLRIPAWLQGGESRFRLRNPRFWLWLACAVTGGYWIVRNLPWWPW